MQMNDESRIAATREQVYAALNDIEILKASIPGCEEIEKTSDTEMTATIVLKVGPVKAKFKGAVKLSDLQPPESYTISGEGKAGPAGHAKGGAKIQLIEDGDGTLLKYQVEANVGGKIAQLGSRLIDSTAKKLAGVFFANFEEQVMAKYATATDAAPSEAAPTSAADASSGISPAVWVVGGIILLALAGYIWMG
jgi:uncharacterized protein